MSNQNNGNVPKIGDIYLMDFGKGGSGSEQSGLRPGVVFQNNLGNTHSPNIIALPITSSLKKREQLTHVLLRSSDTGLKMDSLVLCENPERMSKNKVGKYITSLSESYMKEITKANLLATSAIAFLDIESLTSIWEKASKLNAVPCGAHT